MYAHKKNKYRVFSILSILFLLFSLIALNSYASENPQIKWIRTYNNFNNDKAYSVATDSLNNVIVTGESRISGINKAYTIKYDTNGNILFSITSDLPYASKTYGVAVDSQNNIILAGGALNAQSNYDYYIAKYDPAGNKLWTQSYDSGSFDMAYGVAVDSNDNIVVTGQAANNYCTIKYNKFGVEQWNKTFCLSAENSARSVAVDSYDNVIVTGHVKTSTSRDWYTIKYSANGNELWSKTFSNGKYNYVDGIATNSNNDIIVAGAIYRGTNLDIHLIKYNENGDMQWSTSYDYGVGDYASDVAINSANEIIVAGSVFQQNKGKNYALIKYDDNGMLIWTTFFDRNSKDDYGCGLAVDTQNNIYITGFSKNSAYFDYLTIKYEDTIAQDTQEPEITNVNAQPNPQDLGGYVNISCMATDNIGINYVKVYITDPENQQYETLMIKSGNFYFYNSTFTIPGAYSYYIKAFDTSNNIRTSDIYSFNILTSTNNPPYQPYNPSPMSGATSIDTNASLTWSGGDPDPGDTVTHDVYFGTTSPPPKIIGNQSDTTYKPWAMDLDTTYFWQIVSWDSRATSAQGPIWSFTTVVTPNTPPQKANTPEGQTSGFINVLYQYNTSAVDTDGDAISYGWDWNGDFIVDEWSDWHPSGATCTMHHSWDEPGIYDIRVKTKDIHLGESDIWSEPLTVTIENNPPYEPSDPHPADASTNVGLNVGLWWTGGDPDGHAVTYDVYLEQDNARPTILVSQDQNETYFNPGTLSPNTLYYWQIIAKDIYGASTDSAVWAFTTKESGQNNPPNKPINVMPANGAENIDINPTLSVYVSDPDGDSLSVRFYNAADNGLIGTIIVKNDSTASVQWTALNHNTVYSWYASANDSSLENISDVFSFKTKADDATTEPPNGGSGGTGGGTGTGGTGGVVNSPPTADASASDKYGFVNTIINFDGSLSTDIDGEIVSYYWTFGDGETGVGIQTTHIYTQPGAYSVTLQVTDNNNATDNDTILVTISVPNNPPTKPVITGPSFGVNNTNYSFYAVSNDLDNDTIRYVFNWDDGTNDTTTGFVPNNTIVNVTHLWAEPGMYNLKVYAEDENNAVSGFTEKLLFIDLETKFIEYENDSGYLIDLDSDGVFDAFYDNETRKLINISRLDDGTYLLDLNDDGIWDAIYDPDTDTVDKYETKDDDDIAGGGASLSSYVIGLIVLLIILIVFYILLIAKKKKKEEKEAKKAKKASKK